MALSFVHASFLTGNCTRSLETFWPSSFLVAVTYSIRISHTWGLITSYMPVETPPAPSALAPQAIILKNPGHGEFRLAIAFEN